MSDYHADDAIESLKRFWQSYGRFLTYLVMVILIVIVGTQWWQQNKQSHQVRASDLYTAMIEVAPDQFDKKIAYAVKLVQEYPKTIYADMARLLQAKSACEQRDWSQALSLLTTVYQQTSQTALKYVVGLRLVRVHIEQKHLEEALALLAELKTESTTAEVAALQGDVHRLQGEVDVAAEFYREALAIRPQDHWLQMKYDDLMTHKKEAS